MLPGVVVGDCVIACARPDPAATAPDMVVMTSTVRSRRNSALPICDRWRACGTIHPATPLAAADARPPTWFLFGFLTCAACGTGRHRGVRETTDVDQDVVNPGSWAAAGWPAAGGDRRRER